MTTVKNLNVESINKALIEIQNYVENTEIKEFINKNKNIIENLIAALNFIKLDYNDETTELTWVNNLGIKYSWFLLGTIYNLTVDGDEVVLVNCNNNKEVHITVPYSIKATNDSDGNNIISTYSTKKENETLETALKKLINDGLDTELKRAQKAESVLDKKIDDGLKDINDKIPAEASSTNQLADKNYVDTSITQNTAFFRGTYNSLDLLKAYKGDLTNNDYAFVRETSDDFSVYYARYKYNSSEKEWKFEYYLDNAAFTSEQWASINSKMTEDLKKKLDGIEAGAEVNIQADWTETTTTSDAYIKNKPNVTATTHGADKTISEWSETNGVVDIKFQDIDITHSQINDWPDFKDVATSGSYYDLIDAPGNFITKTDANECVPNIENKVYGEQWYYCDTNSSNTPNNLAYFIFTVKNGNFITQTAYTVRSNINKMTYVYNRTGIATGTTWSFGNWLSQDISTYYFDSSNGSTQYLEIEFTTTSGIRLDCNHGGYYIFGYNTKPISIGTASDSCIVGYKWDTSVSSKPKLYININAYNPFNIRTDGISAKIKKLDKNVIDKLDTDFEKVIYQSTIDSIDVDKVGGDGKYVSAIAQSNAYIVPTITTADTEPKSSSKSLITSGGVYTAIKDITDKIPSQASSTNQLADKDFVNSSISTNTATFYGSFETYKEFEDAWETKTSFSNNDYAVVIADEKNNNQMSRYKYNGTSWVYEYKVNDTPFTSDQLASINSGVTSDIVNNIPKSASTTLSKSGELKLVYSSTNPTVDVKVTDPTISIKTDTELSHTFKHSLSDATAVTSASGKRLVITSNITKPVYSASASDTKVTVSVSAVTYATSINDTVKYTASTTLSNKEDK